MAKKLLYSANILSLWQDRGGNDPSLYVMYRPVRAKVLVGELHGARHLLGRHVKRKLALVDVLRKARRTKSQDSDKFR
jgi:hypothetical protein